ncbi:MAG: DUF1559 domain-containing protein [Planctomycetaceae bacterium]|nr:DUF1559 domain-containing protein [Planctomycetaceae bacterium]
MTEAPSNLRLTWIEIGVAAVVLCVIVALVLPAVQQAREAARRTQSRNNLKQFGLAVHNYHDSIGCLPSGGTFAADGTPFHSWTLFLNGYMAQVAPWIVIDFNAPWDDPVNLSAMREAQGLWIQGYLDPSIPQDKTENGMFAVHYSPNQWLMHRNSSVRLEDLDNTATTLLMSDGFGDFPAFGDPYNWRDPTVPYRTKSTGFGHVVRKTVTHVVFADGHVQAVPSETDPAVTAAWAGPESLRPSPELVAYHDRPYQLPTGPSWTYAIRVRGHKMLMRLKLSPDKKQLIADFGRAHEMDRPFDHTWYGDLWTLTEGATVEDVVIRGTLDVVEFEQFFRLPHLKTLSIAHANIDGDTAAVIAKSPKSIRMIE